MEIKLEALANMARRQKSLFGITQHVPIAPQEHKGTVMGANFSVKKTEGEYHLHIYNSADKSESWEGRWDSKALKWK